MSTSIFVVIVLYKVAPQDSASVVSLSRELNSHSRPELRIKSVLVENGPTSNSFSSVFSVEPTWHFPDNLGLANAYNLLLNMAIAEGYDWILLMDQDTSLPAGYLDRVVTAIQSVSSDTSIAAVLPRVVSGKRVLSPYRFKAGAVPEWFPAGYSGVPNQSVFAINSGALLRVSALRQVGGFDPRFWLDGSDHMIFRSLHLFGKRMYVVGDLTLEHDLSLLGKRGSISRARYSNMLGAESAFWDTTMGRGGRTARTLVVLARAARLLLRRDVPLATLSLRHVFSRVLTRRRGRIVRWERECPVREGTATLADSPVSVVSVCMASYNCEKYIEQQIRSVLDQIGPGDELIIVDDASSDGTVAVVSRIVDSRIKMVQHAKNQGVVATFEHALRCATGDILFLCDGDDIWAENKVRDVLRAFEANPDARVVCTGISLIDEEGGPLDNHPYSEGREFTDAIWRNILRNRFQGSAMAFRSTLLRSVLPLPSGRSFLHDAWIGACNTMTGGKTIYLPQSLLLYRRHANNVSQPMSWEDRIRKRVEIASALAGFWLKRRVSNDSP